MPAVSLLAQPDPLWVLLDAYIAAKLGTWKAQWTETEDAPVYVAEQVNPDSTGYPFILVASYERRMTDADPVIGSGIYSLSGIRYLYQITICAAFDDFKEAKKFAAAASASFIDDLRNDPTLGGLRANNGEFVEQFDFDDGDLYVRGIAGQAGSGQYTGAAVIAIEVQTEV